LSPGRNFRHARRARKKNQKKRIKKNGDHSKVLTKGTHERCFVALGLVPDGAHSVLKGTQRYSLHNIYYTTQRYSKVLKGTTYSKVPLNNMQKSKEEEGRRRRRRRRSSLIITKTT